MSTQNRLSREHRIKISFTPQTPRLNYIFLAFMLYFVAVSKSYSQNLTYSYETMSSSIREDFSQELGNQADYINSFVAFKDSAFRQNVRKVESLKKKWWYYLPTVGFTFGKPAISLNSNIVSQIDFENQKRKTETEFLKSTLNHEIADGAKYILNEFELISLDIRESHFLNRLKDYDQFEFADMKKARADNLITDLEIKKFEKSLLLKELDLWRFRKSILQRILKLQEFSHLHNKQIIISE